jgi:hypothetical protein
VQKFVLKNGHYCRIVDAMTSTLIQTPVNHEKIARAETAFGEILAEVLRRDFYGTAAIELSVQDGTIQHIRRKVERIEK